MKPKKASFIDKLLRGLYWALFFPAAFMALFSGMMFDDPRSIYNPFVYIFVFAIMSFPVSLMMAIFLSPKNDRFLLLPFISVILILLATTGLGWWSGQ